MTDTFIVAGAKAVETPSGLPGTDDRRLADPDIALDVLAPAEAS